MHYTKSTLYFMEVTQCVQKQKKQKKNKKMAKKTRQKEENIYKNSPFPRAHWYIRCTHSLTYFQIEKSKAKYSEYLKKKIKQKLFSQMCVNVLMLHLCDYGIYLSCCSYFCVYTRECV